MHDFAGKLKASAGSSSASIVTSANFHFVSLNQGVVLLEQGVNLGRRFTALPSRELAVDRLMSSRHGWNADVTFRSTRSGPLLIGARNKLLYF
jgi:hypothetical protein